MKIALGVEYDGKQYFGWQKQEKVASVQAELERAISTVANEEISIFCAGRTDSGVHATGQVIHFETTANRPEKAWSFGVNANLPDDIAVRWGEKWFDDDFSCSFLVPTARRYRYILYCNKTAFSHFAARRDALSFGTRSSINVPSGASVAR